MVGDIVKLSLGAVVAADVHLLEGSVLIDQSMLTGESVPIEGGPGLQTYAGALVRRGEAVAEVTATGTRTKFGRTAELVRTAHVTSTQQKVVFRVVRNLAIFNSGVIVLLASYALVHAMPLREMVPLLLTAILSSIPVALPATFTLAAAIGAKALAKLGVLPTRLSAVDEAATMDVLCVDKTGTLTQNAFTVTVVRVAGRLGRGTRSRAGRAGKLRRWAGSGGCGDPFCGGPPKRRRSAEADPVRPVRSGQQDVRGRGDGRGWHPMANRQRSLQRRSGPRAGGSRCGGRRQRAGNEGIPSPGSGGGLQRRRCVSPVSSRSAILRAADSAGLVTQLRTLGVRTIMVTGDAPVTAGIVAHAVGLDGAVCPSGTIPAGLRPDSFAVFAGVLPEDKYHLVQEFQKSGHTVGMCGDGANDAPALRQAQMGIAVSTATDVAKSAAGIVLTEPGLGGIVASVKEGRTIFQRILTYVLKSVTHKFLGALFLLAGILMTGHAVLTPLLLVISMITGDFLSMLATTDNVNISKTPSVWNVGHLTIGGICLGVCDLAFCTGVLAVGKYRLGFDLRELQTLSIVTLIFSGQAILYTVRERRHLWSSRPSTWLMAASVADLLVIGTLATRGILMKPLPVALVAVLLAVTVVFCLLLDLIKVRVFRRLQIV